MSETRHAKKLMEVSEILMVNNNTYPFHDIQISSAYKSAISLCQYQKQYEPAHEIMVLIT